MINFILSLCMGSNLKYWAAYLRGLLAFIFRYSKNKNSKKSHDFLQCPFLNS